MEDGVARRGRACNGFQGFGRKHEAKTEASKSSTACDGPIRIDKTKEGGKLPSCEAGSASYWVQNGISLGIKVTHFR